ncbi:uncharacterized protein PAS_chr2-1_0869 [Komagataella phaffii GS115]|uniref:Karyogamy protein n=2 Tax=Komagataella phaffii TaxID=460519 RepID=C4R179_KOMPG|nr:uncharacterized protein PAS_chr2-1_0869 [Komagataella phaffii GS115]CAY69253.1 hypothetical protein PAS_chr2-1_0869 [Komagataella phaffii GS115]
MSRSSLLCLLFLHFSSHNPLGSFIFHGPMSISDKLLSLCNLSFLDELLQLQFEGADGSSLATYDIKRIQQIVNDVDLYLTSVDKVFKGFDPEKTELKLFIKDRDEYIECFSKVDSIDSVIAQLLRYLENKPDIKIDLLLKRLNNTCEQLMELKRIIYPIKKQLNIAMHYYEINTEILDVILREIEVCEKRSFKIHELRFSSPMRLFPHIDLDILNETMRNSLQLPTFSETDQELYLEYNKLTEKLYPIIASVEYIPPRLNEYESLAKRYRPETLTFLGEKYLRIGSRLEKLVGQVEDLKEELIDKRWDELFRYLIGELDNYINDIEKELFVRNCESLAPMCKYKIDIVLSTLKLLRRAIGEKLLVEISLLQKYNSLNKRNIRIHDELYNRDLHWMLDSFQKQKEENTIIFDGKEQQEIPVFREERVATSRVSSSRFSSRSSAHDLDAMFPLKPTIIEYNPQSAEKPIVDLLADNPQTPDSVSVTPLRETLKHNERMFRNVDTRTLLDQFEAMSVSSETRKESPLFQRVSHKSSTNNEMGKNQSAVYSPAMSPSMIPRRIGSSCNSRPTSALASRPSSRLSSSRPISRPSSRASGRSSVLRVSRPPSSKGSRIPQPVCSKSRIPIYQGKTSKSSPASLNFERSVKKNSAAEKPSFKKTN